MLSGKYQKDLKIIINDEKIDTKYGGDNSKLIKEIGEYNFTKIEESIRKVYNYLDSKKMKLIYQKLQFKL